MKLQVKEHRFTADSQVMIEQVQRILASYEIALTVRQVHYQMVARQYYSNTVNNYRTISGLLTNARYAGLIDWDKIVDDTRAVFKTPSWDSIDQSVDNSIRTFRHDRWADNENYVEVWVEKAALINVMYPTTNAFDVHITPCKGVNSTTAIWTAAERFMKHRDKDRTILYFGDFDPTGDWLHDDVLKRVRQFVDIDVVRVALNGDQVIEHNLPVAYEVLAKKNGKVYNKLEADPRSRLFLENHGELMQVELDALDPAVLLEYLRNAIKEYIDLNKYTEWLDAEKEAKQKMQERTA